MLTTYCVSLTTSIDSIPGTQAPITCGSSSNCQTRAMGAATVVVFSNSMHLFRGSQDRFHDADVPRAAAEIAVQTGAHLLGARPRRAGEQLGGHHDESRRAVAALQPAVLEERLLDRMQFAVLAAQALDGGDRAAAHLQ